MKHIDLTPGSYRAHGRVRRARLLWGTLGVLCALIAAVPIGLEATRAPDPSVALAGQRLVQAENRQDQTRSEIARVRAQLAVQQRELQAQEHLTRRPDWSALMRLVAGAFDEKLLMTGVQMGTPADPPIRTALSVVGKDLPDDSVWLMIYGVAQDNPDVPGLILRLEGLGLFDRVVLTGTRREPYAGGDRTAFVLVCRLD